jgi:CBS domain-containing protein
VKSRAAIAAGARARTTARLFTDCHDRIARRLVELAVADLGAPPCGYAFVALGSAGRRELMPDSDQDDAIVFRPDGGDGEGERGYFLALGDRVCRSLGEVGLPPCTHGIVAMNREWCAPLALWESYFSRWIREPEPENLLEINAFFDMRTIGGDEGITRSLRESVFRMLREEPAFLIHLAQAARNLRIPALPIHDAAAAKEAAALFPAFARAYALKAGIRETGTFDRLDRLAELAAIGADTARESIESFEFLLRGRLEGSLSRMPALGFPPAPLPAREKAQRESGRLVDIQRRAALAQASALQKRIGFDFLGASP